MPGTTNTDVSLGRYAWHYKYLRFLGPLWLDPDLEKKNQLWLDPDLEKKFNYSLFFYIKT